MPPVARKVHHKCMWPSSMLSFLPSFVAAFLLIPPSFFLRHCLLSPTSSTFPHPLLPPRHTHTHMNPVSLSSGSVQCTQPYPAECQLSRLLFPEPLCDGASDGFPSEPSTCWVMPPLLLLFLCVCACSLSSCLSFFVCHVTCTELSHSLSELPLVERSNNKVCL